MWSPSHPLSLNVSPVRRLQVSGPAGQYSPWKCARCMLIHEMLPCFLCQSHPFAPRSVKQGGGWGEVGWGGRVTHNAGDKECPCSSSFRMRRSITLISPEMASSSGKPAVLDWVPVRCRAAPSNATPAPQALPPRGHPLKPAQASFKHYLRAVIRSSAPQTLPPRGHPHKRPSSTNSARSFAQAPLKHYLCAVIRTSALPFRTPM